MYQLLTEILFKTINIDYYAMEYLMGLNCMLAIIGTCILNKKDSISIHNIIPNLFLYVILAPIIEESVFRHTLIDATNHLSYYVELNVMLFSLMHLTNYFIDKNIYKSIITALFAFYPGYYFIMLNNVYKGMIYHALYNAIIMTTSSIICFYIQSNKSNVDDDKRDDTVNSLNIFTDNYYVYHSSLKKSKSSNDLNKNYNFKDFSYISKKSLPLEIIDSIDKYNNIIDTRDILSYNHSLSSSSN